MIISLSAEVFYMEKRGLFFLPPGTRGHADVWGSLVLDFLADFPTGFPNTFCLCTKYSHF